MAPSLHPQVTTRWLMRRVTTISTRWLACWSSTSGVWRTLCFPRTDLTTSCPASVSAIVPAHDPRFSFRASLGARPPTAGTVVSRMSHLSHRLVMAPEWLIVTWSCIFLSAGIENLYERAQCIRKILLGVPRATLVVMRYLFAFLNQWVSSHTAADALIWWLFVPSSRVVS